MQHGYKFVRQAMKVLPLSLANVQGKLQSVANSYLPYSTGLEIECTIKGDISSSVIVLAFNNIPNIMAVDIDYGEQRFRIPNGITGAICLYNICERLKIMSRLNMTSGIHYHIDCTDITREKYFMIANLHCRNKQSFILKALESWGYTGSYNAWEVSNQKQAVRFHERYQTIEFRIGEMTFDYELMIKRILHCQNIVRKLKASIKL